MYMCIEALIKDSHKVILSQLGLLKAQLEKQSVKNRGSLDLNKTRKKSMKHSTQGHNTYMGVCVSKSLFFSTA